MARKRFTVEQINQILRRMQLGESDRSIAKAGLACRNKLKKIRTRAEAKGWLDKGVFIPEPGEAAQVDFGTGPILHNPITKKF